MKNFKRSVVLLSLFSSLLLTRCTPDRDYEQSAKQIISQGSWTIDYYYAGQDRTADYNNYSFSFNGNGTVTATNGSYTSSGAWTILHDVDRNEVLSMTIDSQLGNLTELNDQWTITGISDKNMVLKDGRAAQLHLLKH